MRHSGAIYPDEYIGILLRQETPYHRPIAAEAGINFTHAKHSAIGVPPCSTQPSQQCRSVTAIQPRSDGKYERRPGLHPGNTLFGADPALSADDRWRKRWGSSRVFACLQLPQKIGLSLGICRRFAKRLEATVASRGPSADGDPSVNSL